ncbi:MAG: DNRLRE domain-containing protein [Bacteroidales bacterium]|nr:DNRLRE domain-containing protein [Bacteroidales bacterium]
MKKLISTIILLLVILSCEKKESGNLTGNISFSINGTSLLKNTSCDISEVTKIIVSIENENGEKVHEMLSINLYKFNNSFISEPIALKPGNYKLTTFFAVDSDDQIIYLTPREDSELAYLVTDPLPVIFSVIKDETTKVGVEVIEASLGVPEDFGYATFEFGLIKTFTFCISVFEFVNDSTNFELTGAEIKIVSEENEIYSGILSSVTNSIILPEKEGYKIILKKAGYQDFSSEMTLSEISNYNCTNGYDPFIVILTKNASNIIELQPGPEDGIDALIWNLSPNVPRPFYKEISSVTWTYEGSYSVQRSLLKFDLQFIDTNTVISQASLHLYGITSTGNGTSESLTGPNTSLLCKVTSYWDENTVTWNNQPSFNLTDAVLLDSCNGITDFTIDVTKQVQNMISNPLDNYGWILVLVTEEYHRRMILGSSDNDSASLRPKLVIRF